MSQWFGLGGKAYIATKNGNIHTSPIIETKVRSLTNSDTSTIRSRVISAIASDGIVSKVVLNVLNLHLVADHEHMAFTCPA